MTDASSAYQVRQIGRRIAEGIAKQAEAKYAPLLAAVKAVLDSQASPQIQDPNLAQLASCYEAITGKTPPDLGGF